MTLNATQPTDTDVALATSDATIVGLLPGNKVTVPAHALSAAFQVTGLKRGMATVTRPCRKFRPLCKSLHFG